MRRLTLFFACLSISVLLYSCSSSKKILYFQDIEKNRNLEAFRDYEPAIKKDDVLNIIVSAPNKEVIVPYNMTLGDNLSGNGATNIPYNVDADGYINFPILGQIRVEGLTRRELATLLTQEISKDVKDPIVNISFQNYRVTILGEVNSPGTYTMPSDRTTILQALGMAGDLSISGKRSDILLLRETDNSYEYIRIDLRKTDVLSSPYYYVSQNDVIYVSPNRSRISSGTSHSSTISLITSSLSIVLSVLVLVL